MIIYKVDVDQSNIWTPWVEVECDYEDQIGIVHRYAVGERGIDLCRLRFAFMTERIPGGRRKMEEADVYTTNRGEYAFSLDAVRILAPLLNAQGSRFEQIKCDGVSLFLWTAMPVIHSIDLNRSRYTKYPSGHVEEMECYAFDMSKIGKLAVFKDAEVHSTTSTFCTEVFKQAVERAKLRGFKFTQLWPKKPKAKAKTTKKRSKAEEKKPKKSRKQPKPVVEPLDAEEIAEVNQWVAQWEAISGLSTSMDAPELVLRRICEQLMERAKEEEANDEFAMMAGMAAARVYERALGWKLHRVTADGLISYGCVSPDKAYVFMPHDSVFVTLDEREDPTLLLWFNMIHKGGAPESKPGALLILE